MYFCLNFTLGNTVCDGDNKANVLQNKDSYCCELLMNATSKLMSVYTIHLK